MAPRFLERMQRQSETLKELYGMPQFDPPPYSRLSCYTVSSATTATTATTESTQRTSLSDDFTAASSMASKAFQLPSYQQATRHITFKETPCVPRGSRVLVTGANSWHGMHIVDQLLEEGYRVRGCVRNARKAVEMATFFNGRHDPELFETVIVPDMAVPGAYNAAVRGCCGLIHAAAVRTMAANPYDVIPQTIIGALNMLEAAAREPRMRRVVHCSSVAAAKDSSSSRASVVASDSWNMAAFRLAWDLPPYKSDRAQAVLASATMQAEQTVWKWYREKRPNFILNCVLPDMLWGEFLLPCHAEKALSARILRSIQRPEVGSTITLPPHHFVDVQDSAIIHVAALILPGVMNERLFVIADTLDTAAISHAAAQPNWRTIMLDQEVDMACYKEANRAEDLLIRLRKHGYSDLATSARRAYESMAND